MIYLRCTKQLLDDLALAVDPAPASGQNTILGDWYANVIRIRSCKGLLFTNERTLFSFVVFDVPKARRRDLGGLFTEHLRKALVDEGVNGAGLDAVMKEVGAVRFAKTDNRSVLGSMNDLLGFYRYEIESAGSIYHADLPAIIKKLNRTPQTNLGGKYSIEALTELLRLPGLH